jgi:hypothetical protein
MRTKVERRKMEGINQFRIQYIYTRKCHNETLCIATLNKQKVFFSKIEYKKVKQSLSRG